MHKLFIIVVSLLLSYIIYSCDREVENKIWNPDTHKNKPNPTITGVDPANSTYSGVGIITITGTNFSTEVSENHVYFNAIEGTVLEASETQLTVRVAPVADMRTAFVDSVVMKLRVDGAILYAQYQDKFEYYIHARNLVLEYGKFDNFDNISAITCDIDETLYVTSDNTIYRVEQDSSKEEFGELRSVKAKAMKIGPGGYGYYAQLYALFRMMPDGSQDMDWVVGIPDTKEAIYDLDFDSYGNLYCAGKKGKIYRVNTDTKAVETAATYGDSVRINSVRVYDNDVYVATEYIGEIVPDIKNSVWKNTIISESALGDNELIVNWDAYEYNDGAAVTAITFSSTGEMFIGADGGYALTILHTNGILEPFYQDVLFAPTMKLCWGNSNYLYIIGLNDLADTRVVRVDMLGRSGAPYYGRN